MNNLKVKVVGCGGIGLCLLNVLPRYLTYLKDSEVELSLIDGDSYEEKNRTRQAFARPGNKAEVTAEEIRNKFPGLYCWVTKDYLTEDNVLMHIREGDVIFSCVDNHKTRKLISDRCEELDNVVLFSGGNDFTDGNIQVHVRKDGKNITIPISNQYHPEIAEPADKNPGDPALRAESCAVVQESQPQLLITNNAIAALLLNAFYAWQQGVFESEKRYDEAYTDIILNRVLPRQRKGA